MENNINKYHFGLKLTYFSVFCIEKVMKIRKRNIKQIYWPLIAVNLNIDQNNSKIILGKRIRYKNTGEVFFST